MLSKTQGATFLSRDAIEDFLRLFPSMTVLAWRVVE